MSSSPHIWKYFWAKTDRGNPESKWTRPLWAHLLDVAHTALALWDIFVPAYLRKRIATDLNCSDQDAGRILSLWIGFHDIGKAIPAFQALHEPSKKTLENLGFTFKAPKRKHHGHASIGILSHWLKDHPNRTFFEYVAAFVGAHHGILYPKQKWEPDRTNRSILGDATWYRERHNLLAAVQDAWFTAYPTEMTSQTLSPEQVEDEPPTWLLAFAGWATLADWLGSMAPCFPRDTGTNLTAYMQASQNSAKRALEEAGFIHPSPITEDRFDVLFPRFTPNRMQQALMDIPLEDAPSLIIVEGPTGEGKTEAALVRLARQQKAQVGHGFYLAMPSQATSNGLFERTITFLKHAQQGQASFRLVHGNADLLPQQQDLLTKSTDLDLLYDEDAEGYNSAVYTLRWFLPRKRSLLTYGGLGTVDQAFLSILYTRHFFLRLFSLTGKTIVFDEIHAYDTYMEHLFLRLLQWLHTLGSSVILLSATLPQRLRHKCFKAWNCTLSQLHNNKPDTIPYPAIWYAANGQVKLSNGGFATQWSQTAQLIRCDPDAETIIPKIEQAYRHEAAVVVICNTVRRAQTLFQQLAPEVQADTDNVMLFHGRFRFGKRQRIEQHVLNRFGKKRTSSGGAILIATQVAEQSLDLDADVLFTDLAPIDLVLQRAGRLHRHLSRTRPAGYEKPTVYILAPDVEEDKLPDLTQVGVRLDRFSVYAPTLVWKTYHILSQKKSWTLPDDYRPLIEAVYHDDAQPPNTLSPEAIKAWHKGVNLINRDDAIAREAAIAGRIKGPSEMYEFIDPDRVTLPDEDEGPKAQRALTRLGPESIEVVILFQQANGLLTLDPAGTIEAPLSLPDGHSGLPLDNVRALLDNAVRISYENIAIAIASRPEDELPQAWSAVAEETPALQYRHPLVLTNRQAEVNGFILTDHTTLGLLIERPTK